MVNKITDEHIVLGLFYGIFLVMFIYNLFLYFTVRDRNYLYYVLYIGSYTINQSIFNGISYQYLWPNSPWWQNHSFVFFTFFMTIWVLQFMRSFLDLHKYIQFFNKLAIGMIVISITGTFFSLILPYSIIVFLGVLNAMLACILSFLAGLICMLKGDRTARYYLTAWSVFLFSIIITSLSAGFGILPLNFITQYSMQIGSTLEVTLLSLALADRINLLKTEKFQARFLKRNGLFFC